MMVNQAPTIIGESTALAAALDHISRLAGIDRPVLIVGERGTGKELAAERLHYLSPRWNQAFTKINCSAVTETLLESELFGHEAGAFTGATKRHIGRFELTDGGTLFLDELATMSPRLQEKLLRVIEYGEFERVGGQKTLRVDVRLVGATNADLPAIMADYHMMILPSDLPADAGVGTGPFVKEMFEPGVRWAATRNPDYWDGDRPYVDAVELSVVNDPTARLAALRSGQAHMINRVDAKTISLLKRDPNVQILRSPAWAHYTLPMHCDKPPFDNHDLRMAMKYAYDREQMLTQILRGYGSLGNDTPIAPTNPYFNAEMPQRTYDPDKAAFHYKKSGHSGPLQVHTSDAAFAGAIDAAVLFKENAAKAGITVDVIRDPADGYWSDVWLKVPACYVFWAGRPTPDMIFSTAYAKGAAWNEAKWDNAKFNELLVKARAELDFDKRKAMYAEMQTLVNTDGGTIVPVFNDWLDAGTKAVKGFEPHPLFDFSGHKAAEKVWLDEG